MNSVRISLVSRIQIRSLCRWKVRNGRAAVHDLNLILNMCIQQLVSWKEMKVLFVRC